MKLVHLILGTVITLFTCICSAQQGITPLSPKEYGEIHNLASKFKDPKWAEAMKQLGTIGDAFTLEHLKTIKPEDLNSDQSQVMQETITATTDRVAKEDPKSFIQLIESRLERAALVDANCDPLENTLVPWTRELIRQHLVDPGVTTELKRIQSDYVPKDKEPTQYSSIEKRVRRYAEQLLGK
jgi:hypothetical protein